MEFYGLKVRDLDLRVCSNCEVTVSFPNILLITKFDLTVTALTAVNDAPASVTASVSESSRELVEDSQVPEGGPLLVMPETYGGAEADNERDDNESSDEETQMEKAAADAAGKSQY